jgi:hypothetical protein
LLVQVKDIRNCDEANELTGQHPVIRDDLSITEALERKKDTVW